MRYFIRFVLLLLLGQKVVDTYSAPIGARAADNAVGDGIAQGRPVDNSTADARLIGSGSTCVGSSCTPPALDLKVADIGECHSLDLPVGSTCVEYTYEGPKVHVSLVLPVLVPYVSVQVLYNVPLNEKNAPMLYTMQKTNSSPVTTQPDKSDVSKNEIASLIVEYIADPNSAITEGPVPSIPDEPTSIFTIFQAAGLSPAPTTSPSSATSPLPTHIYATTTVVSTVTSLSTISPEQAHSTHNPTPTSTCSESATAGLTYPEASHGMMKSVRSRIVDIVGAVIGILGIILFAICLALLQKVRFGWKKKSPILPTSHIPEPNPILDGKAYPNCSKTIDFCDSPIACSPLSPMTLSDKSVYTPSRVDNDAWRSHRMALLQRLEAVDLSMRNLQADVEGIESSHGLPADHHSLEEQDVTDIREHIGLVSQQIRDMERRMDSARVSEASEPPPSYY